MLIETFTWPVFYASPGTIAFRTLTAQFGDGYEQRASDGIHNRRQSWECEFICLLAERDQIKDFLDRHAGWRAFLWAPPGEPVGQYRTYEYVIAKRGANLWSITCTFVLVFKP